MPVPEAPAAPFAKVKEDGAAAILLTATSAFLGRIIYSRINSPWQGQQNHFRKLIVTPAKRNRHPRIRLPAGGFVPFVTFCGHCAKLSGWAADPTRIGHLNASRVSARNGRATTGRLPRQENVGTRIPPFQLRFQAAVAASFSERVLGVRPVVALLDNVTSPRGRIICLGMRFFSRAGREGIGERIEFLCCHTQPCTSLSPAVHGLSDLGDNGFAPRR